MALKLYSENNTTVIDVDGKISICRVSIDIEASNKSVYIKNIDDESVDWSRSWDDIQDKNGDPIGSTLTEVLTYISENTVFSSGAGGSAPNKEALKLGKARFVIGDYTLANPFQVTTEWKFLPLTGAVMVDADFSSLVSWIDSNGIIQADNGNQEDYLGRLSFDGKPSVNNANIEFFLDIGAKDEFPPENNTIIPIERANARMLKGVGVEHSYSFKFDYYAGTTFLANGCRLYVKGSNPIEIYNLEYKKLKLTAK